MLFKRIGFLAGVAKTIGERNRSCVFPPITFCKLHYLKLANSNNINNLEYIDGGIYSFDAGSRKPDSAIYEYALEKSGAKANESVFIDDLIDNIKAAEKQGFLGIHYVGEDQLLEDLNNLGIEIDKMVALV